MKRARTVISYTTRYNRFKMTSRTTRRVRWQAQPRWRVWGSGGIAIGPGKRDLLEAIQKEGSISAAAAAMGMSYRRAWMLVETMNRCFRKPLVVTSRGRRGGTSLTRDGRRALGLYNTIETASLKTARRPLATLWRMLN